MELKWRKLPTPEKLREYPEVVSRETIPFLKHYAREFMALMVNRTLAGYGVNNQGQEIPLPPYSKAYAEAKGNEVGVSFSRPNYALDGTLLNHLSLKIKLNQKDQSAGLIIAPYGRTDDNIMPPKTATKEVVREAYSYTNSKGKTVHVPETRMVQKVLSDWQKAMRAKYKNPPRYNAHLAWYLAHRTGGGGMASLTGPSTHHFLAYTTADLAEIRADWIQSLRSRGALNPWGSK